MTFSNIPNYPALGFTQILTHDDNIRGVMYNPGDGDPILSALDINWCGAQLSNSSDNGGNKSINTTEELLTLVNDMNKRLYTLAAAVVALSNR